MFGRIVLIISDYIRYILCVNTHWWMTSRDISRRFTVSFFRFRKLLYVDHLIAHAYYLFQTLFFSSGLFSSFLILRIVSELACAIYGMPFMECHLWNRSFPSYFVPLCQYDSSCETFHMEEFDLHENEPVGGTHFQMNGFERRLV